MPRSRLARRIALTALLLASGASAARAAGLLDNGPAIHIARATGPIEVDGDLSDPGWQGAEPIEGWFETNPGDSIPVAPELKNLAWMAYDDHYLYAAFQFDDPEPQTIKSQLGDHDQIGGGGLSDYGGLILDPRGDGKVAQMFLANASSIEYDAISSDAERRGQLPRFLLGGRRQDHRQGVAAQDAHPLRVDPLRRPEPRPLGRAPLQEPAWTSGTSTSPRSCLAIATASSAPARAHRSRRPAEGCTLGGGALPERQPVERPENGPGSRLDDGTTDVTGGLDFKYLPTPNTVIDATINPDFSQIESDTAKITANERFALFQPERRPFFLESVDLFSTPIQAVYTRTFTDPRWGVRATGGSERTKYTVLVGEDQGGGLVVLPGSNSSRLAPQDFSSTVAIGRVRREYGRSFVSFLYAGREVAGGGHNRVLGPDFEWRPRPTDTITGQFLWSDTETPDRPELAAEWDGRSLEGHAGRVAWSYGDGKWDSYVRLLDISREFRADDGFVPQVGYRSGYEEIGRSWHPTSGPVRRVRLFTYGSYSEDSDGNLLERQIVPGVVMDALLNSFVRVELAQEDLRAVTRVFRRRQVRPGVEFYPGRYFAYFAFDGAFGDEIDFANDRLGTGTTLTFSARFNSGKRLQISPFYTRRTLDVTTASGLSGRLVTANVARVKLTWNFNARAWLRVIGQEKLEPPAARALELPGSGTGPGLRGLRRLRLQAELADGPLPRLRGLPRPRHTDVLRPAERQIFFKVSYAFRR